MQTHYSIRVEIKWYEKKLFQSKSVNVIIMYSKCFVIVYFI